LIVAMLTLCVPNIAAAPASKQTSVTHSSFAMDASVKEKLKLVLLLSNNVTTVIHQLIFSDSSDSYERQDKRYRRRDGKDSTCKYGGTLLAERTLTTMSLCSQGVSARL